MKIFRESPHTIVKIPIFLFWIISKVYQGFKIGNDWHHFWCPHLGNHLARNWLWQIVVEALLELPGQFGSSIIFCFVMFEQLHLVWKFGKVFVSLFDGSHLFFIKPCKFKYVFHDASAMEKSKFGSNFKVPNRGCYKSTPLTGISFRDSRLEWRSRGIPDED